MAYALVCSVVLHRNSCCSIEHCERCKITRYVGSSSSGRRDGHKGRVTHQSHVHVCIGMRHTTIHALPALQRTNHLWFRLGKK